MTSAHCLVRAPRLLLGLCVCLLGLGACATRPPVAAPVQPDANALTDDRSPEVLFESGLQAQRAGDSTRAEQYFGAALTRGYPVNKAFPALIGVCITSDRFDTALYYARARLVKEPGDWALRYLVATLLVGAGQEHRAVLEIHRLIDEQPARPEPHYLLGVVARDSLGDRRLAVESFKTYLSLAPTGPHMPEARAFLKEDRRPAGQKRMRP